ncbi:MAG TPA: cellulase family glycosylhydrolase [Solirubrobacteraceae bacterium]|nr:cellulase family glycosylhydrolase [Solirubrobacteraceae bacterium]
MGVRLVAAAAVAAVFICAPPAQAVETGVNETVGQSVSTPRKATRLGADWMRVWAVWQDLEPARGAYAPHPIDALAEKVAALHARGVKVLVVVHRAPAWASGGGIAPPRDPASFGRFMGGLAQRVPGVDAWELWNEPDGSEFWAGGPDPAHYAQLLKAAYPAIKAVQPGDVVVTGGMVGNDMDFLSALYDHGAQGSFDAVGVHTDTACLTRGPDAYYRDERGRVGRYTFTGYREVHAVMSDHGDGAKPIWMTELGWNTQSTRPRSCNTGAYAGKKRIGVSKRRQARFLRAAYRCLAADPFVGVALWFGMQDGPGSAHARAYGLYRAGGKGKPAAKAFRRLDRGIRPRRGCGGYVDRTPPTIRVAKPVQGKRFAGRIAVRVRAFDDLGGSGLGRIFLAHNGRHVRSWRPPGGSIAPWWESERWRPGTHTLTFSVRDRAFNQASLTVTVEKLRR